MSKYDFRAYLTAQQQEAYRSFVIHAPAMSYKTEFARRIRDKVGAYLLDLQTHFAQHVELAARIDTFRPDDLKRLLFALDTPEPVVIVDNTDLLFNTWTRHHHRQFVGMLDRGWRASVDTNKTFIFFVQSGSPLTRFDMRNNRGQPRILPLENFYAL